MPHPPAPGSPLDPNAASSAAAATPTSANAVAGDDTSAMSAARPGSAAATIGVGTVDASTRAVGDPPGATGGAALLSVPAARALAVLVTVLWASSWVLIRWGGDHGLAPLSFAALRYLAAAAVLGGALLVVNRQRGPLSSGVPVRRLAALGLLQYAVTQGAQFVAIAHQPLATTTVLLASTPLLTAFGASLTGERVARRHLVAAGLIVAGAVVYLAGEMGATAVGLLAASVGLLANAGAALYGRWLLHGTVRSSSATLLLTWQSMTIGAVTLGVTALAVEGAPLVTWPAAGLIGWLAVVNTVAAFWWWNLCLRSLPATEMAAINGLMMPQIAAFGWVFFGEALGVREVIGLAAVVTGIWLCTVGVPRGRRWRTAGSASLLRIGVRRARGVDR